MSVVFISYADGNFKESLLRIKRQAKRLGIFNRIIAYTPKDLPLYIKSSPLMAFSCGGGYWAWKPYIIHKTLSECEEGDIVVYVDAGCRLAEGLEWKEYLSYLDTYHAILFQYRNDCDYGWQKVYGLDEKNASPAILHWMKPSCIDFFNQKFDSVDYLDYNKIWGGFMMFRKTKDKLRFVEDWYSITLFHPELVMDPYGVELDRLPASFSRHRHDQSIITPLAYYYHESDKILVLPEKSESDKAHAVVAADRYQVGKLPLILYLKYKIYHFIHKDI